MNETCKSKFAGTLGLETLVVIVANIVTIFVFCKNRYHLKKTSLVLINLSVADLMVGTVVPLKTLSVKYCGCRQQVVRRIGQNIWFWKSFLVVLLSVSSSSFL